MKIVVDEPLRGYLYCTWTEGQATLGAAFELWVRWTLDPIWWDRHSALMDWFDAR